MHERNGNVNRDGSSGITSKADKGTQYARLGRVFFDKRNPNHEASLSVF